MCLRKELRSHFWTSSMPELLWHQLFQIPINQIIIVSLFPAAFLTIIHYCSIKTLSLYVYCIPILNKVMLVRLPAPYASSLLCLVIVTLKKYNLIFLILCLQQKTNFMGCFFLFSCAGKFACSRWMSWIDYDWIRKFKKFDEIVLVVFNRSNLFNTTE